MPWREPDRNLTDEQIIKSVEESNARPNLKANICVYCRLLRSERTAYPLDRSLPDNYADHLKTHEETKQ